MKAKHFLIWFALFLLLADLTAQDNSDTCDSLFYSGPHYSSVGDSIENAWKPCISPFVELLGKGFLSLNVDYRPKESYSISFGVQPFEGISGLMFYYFSGARHRFETGAGLSLGISHDFELKGVLIHGVIGYRYQKKKGLFFRAGFTPLFVILPDDPDRSGKLLPFVGLSFGYSF